MTNLDSLFEFLTKESLDSLERMAHTPEATGEYLKTDYLPAPESAEDGIQSDSQESAEAATLEGQYIPDARRTWRKLTPEAQAGLREIFTSATDPATMELLEEYLASNAVW